MDESEYVLSLCTRSRGHCSRFHHGHIFLSTLYGLLPKLVNIVNILALGNFSKGIS